MAVHLTGLWIAKDGQFDAFMKIFNDFTVATKAENPDVLHHFTAVKENLVNTFGGWKTFDSFKMHCANAGPHLAAMAKHGTLVSCDVVCQAKDKEAVEEIAKGFNGRVYIMVE